MALASLASSQLNLSFIRLRTLFEIGLTTVTFSISLIVMVE
jgi:hypothetical protein